MKPDRALPQVLLVDDDDDDALLFTRKLKAAGFRNPVLHLRNGGDAFAYLRQFCVGHGNASKRPCLVFLDVNMPNLSGFDLLLWARRQSALAGMKIIMLSGATEPWDAKIAAQLGADQYLKKFPEPESLGELLSAHLGKNMPEPTER